jgi:phage shock protein E
MINFLKNIFGTKSPNFKKLVLNGAQIIDVRTPSEFENGNIRKATNIPLQLLASEMKKLDVNKPIITCCESGMRSASAKSILMQNGFEVYNGGGWKTLQNELNK